MLTTKINYIATAIVGLTMWGWLPTLKSVSELAAEIVPIVTLLWIAYQFAAGWRKPKQ